MARTIIFRILGALVTLAVTSFVVYGALFLAPGSPINFLIGPHSANPATIARLETQYHLNDPFFQQWWTWVTGVLHGDFGYSIVARSSVSSLIGPRIGTTVLLIAYAGILTIGFGVVGGIFSGLRPGKIDGSVTVLTSIGLGVPQFVSAVVFITVFAVNLKWFPTFGGGSGFADQIYHLTLPALALALSGACYVSRLTRAAVRDETGREHVVTARARGLSSSAVVRRHVLRNAAIPVVTVSGLTVAGLIAGTVVVESAFGINGIGALLVQSVQQSDFPTVQAITLVMVAAFILVNTIVDLAYLALDPRIRARSAAG
ncbi:MAG: ABC transporter permease [Actinobacteria bacterium]|nr:ABC transporter permease [Actinomycetota bacterium]